MENKKFECKSCGTCCKKFGEKGLPLFEFEVDRLKKISTSKNLDIRPVEIFLDRISGKKFCVLYGLFNQPCIFLENNKCKIYDDRFFICRQFPIFSTEKFKFAKIKGKPEFFECKCFDCKMHFKENNFNEKELNDFYGGCYEAALDVNNETERIMKLLLNLQKQGKIDLEGVNYQTIEDSEKISSLKEYLESMKFS